MMHSLKQYGSREVAMACLFLAGKVEESLRKVEAVVNYLLRLEDRRKGKEPDVHPTSEVGRQATTRGDRQVGLTVTVLSFGLSPSADSYSRSSTSRRLSSWPSSST